MPLLFKFLYFLFVKNIPNSYSSSILTFNTLRIFIIKRFIKIGRGCKVQKNVYFGENVQIGDFCQINENVKLRNVVIGSNVMIAPGVTIIGNNHVTNSISIPIMYQGEIVKKIVIEDDIWIGTNAIILAGVFLKKGCVIGAGAVVTKDCEEYGVYGGVPAKLIKSRQKLVDVK